MPGLAFVACVVNRTYADHNVATIGRIDAARYAVEKLTSGHVETLALDQFQERRTGVLAIGMFVEHGTTTKRYIRRANELDFRSHFWRVATKRICTHVDLARIFDQQIAIFARVNRVAAD